MAGAAVEEFLDAAQAYVAVIDSAPAVADDDFLFAVVRVLTALHHAALRLPKPPEEDEGGVDISTDRSGVESRLRAVLGELVLHDHLRSLGPHFG